MVQLKYYYTICGVTDRGACLGVEEDTERGLGFITLAKNVLSRYRFSDQKQLNAWTSVDHLTAPVIYDTEAQNYIGVFCENTIKKWDANITNLDNLKKYKFSKPILRLVKDKEGKCSVIFKDGFCMSLEYAIASRKKVNSVDFLDKDENIDQCQIFYDEDTAYVCYILKKGKTYSLLTCELNVDINSPIVDTVKRLNIERQELVNGTVKGLIITQKANPPQVHVLWNDGRLFSISLIDLTVSPIGHVPRICSESNVSMAWVGDDNIALYGADLSRERAILVIYNTLFGVLSCSHPLKMFCEGMRLWCLTDFLILEAANHIAVIPYILSSERDALSLIGSHKSQNENETVRIIDWGEGKPETESDLICSDLVLRGFSERDMCSQFFPTLFEERDFSKIKNAIESFTDIPENLMVDILNRIITHFNTDEELTELHSKQGEICSVFFALLKHHFNRESMIPKLRHGLPFDDAIFLLKYFNFMLSDTSDSTAFDVEFEQKIINWAITILDAHFQQILLSSESSVNEIICSLIITIDNLIENVEMIEAFISILNSVRIKKEIDSVEASDSHYYIEEVVLKM